MPGFLAMADAAGLLEVLGQPFMQRALLGGLLTGALGGLLGSFAVLRQLSFFSDALGWSDLSVIAVLLLGALIYLALSLRAQVLLTLNSDLAGAFGVGANRHRLAFIMLLAVVVAVSIKAVGVLLISAFVVIPACGGRLVSRHFPLYALLSACLGGGCALLGLLGSGLTNLPSGPCVVIVQFAGFLLALVVSQQTRPSPAVAGPAGPRIPGAGPADPESR